MNVRNKFFIDTPIGKMIIVGDDNAIFLLKFIQNDLMQSDICYDVPVGETNAIISIKQEIKSYFAGYLKKFTTPIVLRGTDFQKKCWNALMDIPYAHVLSYKQQANTIGNLLSYRAVANANSKNNISVIVPCHRVINTTGQLSGYNGGVERKKWLIEHERLHKL